MRTAYSLLAAIALFPFSVFAAAPGELRTMAHSVYEWYDEAYPVAASSLGDHRFHARLTDYRMSEVVRRRQHVSDLLAQVRELETDGWSKDDRIDRVLFESKLASMDFFGRRLKSGGLESAAVRRRVLELDLHSVAERVCASSHARARGDEPPRADARAPRGRAHEPDGAGQALCVARDRVCPRRR